MRLATALLACTLLLCAAPASAQQLAPPPVEIGNPDVQSNGGTTLDALLNNEFTFQEGERYGREYGREKSTLGWKAASFAGGLVLGPIGAGLTYGLAEQKVPETTPYRSEIADRYSRDFYGGWSKGYAEVFDQRRERAALTSGIVGTAIGVGALLLLAR